MDFHTRGHEVIYFLMDIRYANWGHCQRGGGGALVISSLFSQLSFPLVGCIRVLQRNWANNIYDEKLAHMIMEAKKYHNLPSASWLLRKASGVSQTDFHSLRTRGTNGVIPSLRAEDPYFNPYSQAKKEPILLPFAFCSIQVFNR